MKSRFFLALILAIGLPVAVTAGAAAPTIIQPDSTHWTAGTGQMAGMQMAVLYGNPAKPGPFTIRLKVPDGTKLPPHYHNDMERVTIISGTFMVGIGNKVDAAKMTALGPGAYAIVPAKLPHYGTVKGETVVQIDGNGPFAMIDAKGHM